MSGNYKIALTTILVFIVFCSISHAEEQSLDEISRKLENPLTNLWALTFQENFRSEGPINLPSVSGDAGWFDSELRANGGRLMLSGVHENVYEQLLRTETTESVKSCD